MRKFTAGTFAVTVSSPSPMWVEIEDLSRSGETLRGMRFHPSNLSDLKHLIERAMAHVEQYDPGSMA